MPWNTINQKHNTNRDGSADRARTLVAQTLVLPAAIAGLNYDFVLLSTCGNTSSPGRAPFPGHSRPALPRARAPRCPCLPPLSSL